MIAADAGKSLASKRDAVVDRQAKRDVVNEEKRRARVRRKVIEDIGARGVAFRQVSLRKINLLDTHALWIMPRSLCHARFILSIMPRTLHYATRPPKPRGSGSFIFRVLFNSPRFPGLLEFRAHRKRACNRHSRKASGARPAYHSPNIKASCRSSALFSAKKISVISGRPTTHHWSLLL